MAANLSGLIVEESSQTATSGPLIAEIVRVRILEAPITSVVPMSFSALKARRMCLVEIHAGGEVGIGESWINYPDWAPRERIATVLEGAAEVILGTDVSSPELTMDRMKAALLSIGRQAGAPGPMWQAMSGVDLALWDLCGKIQNSSVGSLLTTQPLRPSIAAYASGVGPTHVVELCERAMDLGLRAVKAKVGFGHATDLETLSTIRHICGDDVTLLADANQAWDLPTAKVMSKVLIDQGVSWLEEPLGGNRLADLEALYRFTGLPIATGENVYGYEDFMEYMESPAISQIQPDVGKTGGISVAAALARSAGEMSVRVSPHWYGAALGLAGSLQLGAAFPSVEWIELDVRENPLRDELLLNPFQIADGAVQVPTSAGLAGGLDPEAIARYQIHESERK